jgi:hypothetical protein
MVPPVLMAYCPMERLNAACGQTSLREEVGRVAHEGTAAEGLDDPTPGRDLGAAQVGSLEAVEV